jgi:acetyl-CoA carboxylase biotin carboxyl carrier protein
MKIDEIRELIRVVLETQIAELEVRQGDNTVRIRRGGPAVQDVVVPTVLPISVSPVASATAATSVPPAIASPEANPAAQPAVSKEDEQNALIKSPIVGTYYDSPSPGAAPFVRVGDRVEPKQVLCIIESMKLMNEIEAETAGIVVSKFVENGRPVEYGEALFTIRPA